MESDLNILDSIPRELVDEFSGENGIIFVGAGLSMGAGLPSWEKLIIPLKKEIKDCPENSSLLDIAQYFVNEHGRHLLIQRLLNSLDQYNLSPSVAHNILVSLPVHRIFTTNFDSLLEISMKDQSLPYRIIIKPENIPFIDPGKKQLFKLHGHLEQPDTIVITSEDFENYFEDHPAIADLLKVELQTKTVLFVGYSFNDINFRMILRRVSREVRGLRRNFFAIMVDAGIAEITALEKQGIKVIHLQKFIKNNNINLILNEWLEGFKQELNKNKYVNKVVPAKIINNNLPPRFGNLLGRKADFERTIEGLKSRYPLITIEGFSGVGKTSLAIEVGHSCALSDGNEKLNTVIFDYIVWVSAASKPNQKLWFNDVLNAIAITSNNDAYSQKQYKEFNQKILEVEKLLRIYQILLIIDNYETIDDLPLKAWLESVPEKSKVIITTRDRQLEQKAWAVTLKGLQPLEALQLIRQHSNNIGLPFIQEETDQTLLSLCTVTDGNPQAIKLALGLIKGGIIDLKKVVNQLHEGNPEQRIDQIFTGLFSWSWSILSENAKQIMLVTPLFVGVNSINREALRITTNLPLIDFEQGLEQCVRFGLLEVNNFTGRYIIHSMTRAFARDQLSQHPGLEKKLRLNSFNYFLILLNNSIIREKPSTLYWNALVNNGMVKIDPEWPSIKEAMKWADQEGHDDFLVKFVMHLIHYMDSRFLNVERLYYVKRVINIYKKQGKKQEEALLRIDALGWTYVEEDKIINAFEEINTGLQLLEELSGTDKDDLIRLAYAWKARAKIEQDSVDEAKDLIQQALLMNCNPWIKCRVNMAAGDIELKQGNWKNALEYFLEAKAEADSYNGEGHGYQIGPRIGLAFLGAGNLNEAENIFRELLKYEQIEIGKLYADYGLAMVQFKRGGDTTTIRTTIDVIKSKLSRRTQSNLLLKLINKLYEDLEVEGKYK